MTPRIRSIAAAEPLVPPQFRAAQAPQIFREFVETLQRLHDQSPQPAKKNGQGHGSVRARPKARRARKAAK
jgi:hypothetical protein